MNSVTNFNIGRWRQAIIALLAVLLLAGQTFVQEAKDATPLACARRSFTSTPALTSGPHGRRPCVACGGSTTMPRKCLRSRSRPLMASMRRPRRICGPSPMICSAWRENSTISLAPADKVINDLADGISRLFGGEHLPYKDWADRFNDYAGKSFVRMVFDPETLQQAVRERRSATSPGCLSWKTRRSSISSWTLRTGPWGRHRVSPIWNLNSPGPPSRIAFSTACCDASTADIGATAVRWYVSEKVAGKLTEKQPDGFRKFVTNAAVGNQVEGAIEGGMKMVGYDPQGAIAARMAANFDFNRNQLIGLRSKGRDIPMCVHSGK